MAHIATGLISSWHYSDVAIRAEARSCRQRQRQRQKTMFQTHTQNSNSSAASLVTEGTPSVAASKTNPPGTPQMLHKFGSNETLSVLSRSITATSVNSTSTINTTFETNWMPNSFVVSKKKYKISLKLKTSEIELLRKSWAIVTSNETYTPSSNGLEPLSSRSSSMTGLNLMKTNTGSSNQGNPLNGGSGSAGTGSAGSSGPGAGSGMGAVSAGPGKTTSSFNTASFSSFLFCIQFYNNLISMDPEIENMIPSIRHQASAFAGVITVAIGTLEDLSKMKESLLNLGHLHARILGIDSPYFKIMGEALIKTFQDWFGNSPESFPLELEEAWIKLYCFLANSIIQGGIDPVIEYNLQSARKQAGLDENSQIDEDEEIDDDERADQLTNLQESDVGSSYNPSSATDDSLKKSAASSKNSPSQPVFSKYEPSISSTSNSKSSYIPKNINRLKKSRTGANREDCTIM